MEELQAVIFWSHHWFQAFDLMACLKFTLVEKKKAFHQEVMQHDLMQQQLPSDEELHRKWGNLCNIKKYANTDSS